MVNSNENQVFRASLVWQALVVIGAFAFVTVFVVNFEEWWVTLFYLAPLILLVGTFKTKVVLEGEKVVSYTIFDSDEVRYKEIAEVNMRKTQNINDEGSRTTTSEFYFLDEKGNLFFTIGISGIGGKKRRGEFFRLLKEKNPEIILDGHCQGLMELG